MFGSKQSTRLAIVDYDKCKPKKCGKECVVKCPANQSGKKCVVIDDIEDIGKKKAVISAEFCIGCGLCVKACPFKAINIVNLPKELSDDKMLLTYGDNSFRVYMYPQIKKGSCVGIIGSNGLGKSSIIKILSGDTTIDTKGKKKLLSGSQIYGYLDKLGSGDLVVSYKPQDISIYNRGKAGKTKVSNLLKRIPDDIQERMGLKKLAGRTTKQLSGGETQRLLISLACAKNADSYLFDEPTAFLDIKQRIVSGQLIQEQVEGSYVVLIEHDLCIFDYISDYVVSLYGEKGAYGVVSSLSGTFAGINSYLEGYHRTENVKFRSKPVKFQTVTVLEEIVDRVGYDYGTARFGYGSDSRNPEDTFSLEIEPGSFATSEITLLIGENGTGKSTMIKMLAGIIKVPGFEMPELSVSIKEQEVYLQDEMTVYQYIHREIGNLIVDYNFKSMVLSPLKIHEIYDLDVNTLSGGQMQKVGIVTCLGKKADIYLLDEPSAYIDVEDRMVISKVIKQFILFNKKTMFLVEHDMIMATSTCDKVIVFTGEPGVKCKASSPMDLKTGINQFLSILDITMRRDKYAGSSRPRINKPGSLQDREQKKMGQYFIIE